MKRVTTVVVLVGLAAVLAVSASASSASETAVASSQAFTFRETDARTGEQISESRSWKASDLGMPVVWTERVFPDGDREMLECIYGKGLNQPATTRLDMILSRDGQLERSDFDTLDADYYPFLRRPLPNAPLTWAECIGSSSLDINAIENGSDASLWLWVNDTMYFRIVASADRREVLALPAGSYDAIKLRARADMATIVPQLPNWLARLMSVVAPTIEMWVTRTPPHDLLKISGLNEPGHQQTTSELVKVGPASDVTPIEPDRFRAVATAPSDPPLRVANCGSFNIGDQGGRVEMSTAQTPGGSLLVVRATMQDGLAIENRAWIKAQPTRHAVSMEQRTYARNGALVQRRYLAFNPEAFPFGLQVDREITRQLPSDLYPSSLVLGLILPDILHDALPDATSVETLNTLGFDGALDRLDIWRDARPPASDTSDSGNIGFKLKPVISFPFYLTPFARFLTPTFEVSVESHPTRRLVGFKGPFGPPGSPEMTFVGDRSPNSACGSEASAAAQTER